MVQQGGRANLKLVLRRRKKIYYPSHSWWSVCSHADPPIAWWMKIFCNKYSCLSSPEGNTPTQKLCPIFHHLKCRVDEKLSAIQTWKNCKKIALGCGIYLGTTRNVPSPYQLRENTSLFRPSWLANIMTRLSGVYKCTFLITTNSWNI